jgi:hypothetical protein
MKTIKKIFNDLLLKETNIFKKAINFSTTTKNNINPGIQFEENIKQIFNENEIYYE